MTERVDEMFDSRPVNRDTLDKQIKVRRACKELANAIDTESELDPRHKSMALTKLQEFSMIVQHGLSR